VSGTVKRAFEIAPDCTTIDEIRSRLREEGYANVFEHLQGSSIQKQLRLRLRNQDQVTSS
jgi:ribosomal protein S8